MIRYARGTSKHDAHPAIREVPDFDTFAKKVLADRARTKGQQYVCAPFQINGDGTAHRCAEGVEPRRFLALDVDHIAGAETYAELCVWLMRFKGFGFTTASSKPDAPRCRVIIELDRDVDRVEGMRLGAAISRDLNEEFSTKIKLDSSTYRGEQPCYGPVSTSEEFHLDGEPLDVEVWLTDAPSIEPTRKGKAAIDPGDDPVIVELKERGMYRRDLGAGRHAIRCPWEAEHSTVDDDQSTATCCFQPHHEGYKTYGLKCLHEHCAKRAGDDLLKFLELDWRDVKAAYEGGSESKRDEHKGAPGEWPEALHLEVLADHEPEAPRFIIPDWFPVGYATLFAGHGGVGKSGIALHLAVCMAAGVPFFGIVVARRRIMYLSCEDRENILHWRLSRICRHLGIDLGSLRGWLEIIDLVGRDAVLWERDPHTGHTVTAAFGRLECRVREYQTQVIFIDGISDTYAGNEITRSDVKRFVNAVVGLIPPDEGAALLVGHLNKPTASGVQTTEGYSGSTAWHNSVRARWYLYPETAQADDGARPARTGDLILELQKSNLGRVDQSIRFAWDDDAHMFLGREVMGEMAFDKAHRERSEREGVIEAFRALATSKPPVIVPAATSGQRTAHHVLSAHRDFPKTLRGGKAARTRFWRLIEELRQSGALIECEHLKPNRHKTVQFVLSSEGMRQCVEC